MPFQGVRLLSGEKRKDRWNRLIARGGDLTKMQLRSVGPTLSATSPMALGPMHANPDRFVNVIFYTAKFTDN